MIEKNFNLDHITGLSDTMFNTIMFNNEDILRNILSLVLDDEIGEIEYLTEYKSALEFVKNHKTLELYLRNSNSYVTIAYYKNYNIAIIYQKLGFNDDGSLIKLDDDIKCAKFIVLDCYKKSYKEKVTAYLRNQYNEILTYKFSYIEFYFKNLEIKVKSNIVIFEKGNLHGGVYE